MSNRRSIIAVLGAVAVAGGCSRQGFNCPGVDCPAGCVGLLCGAITCAGGDCDAPAAEPCPGGDCGPPNAEPCAGGDCTAPAAPLCGDAAPNACGGCSVLNGAPGAACGACGTYACNGSDALVCNDPGANACGGCTALTEPPGAACDTCGSYICSPTGTVSCNANVADYTARIVPSSYDATTPGCTASDDGLNDGTCGAWKVYDVIAGEWLGIVASDEYCGTCADYHVAFDIQENSGAGWTTVEHHDPQPDAQGMLYTTSYLPSTAQIRIITSNNPGFYVQVYWRGVQNGGFETGSLGSAGADASTLLTPSITNNATFVAGRGTFAFGAASPCGTGTPASCSTTYSSNDETLWGITFTVCPFGVTSGSMLYFDTFGEPTHISDYIVHYAHYHVKFIFADSSSATFNSYAGYAAGIATGWSEQSVDLSSYTGKTITQLDITFHKDESNYARYPPGIFLDNVSLR